MYKRIISLILIVLLSVSLVAPGLTSAQTSSFSDSSNPSESRTESLELPPSNELSSGWNSIAQNINPVVDAPNLTNGNTTSSFNDVKQGDWFFVAANYVYKNGLFQGTGEHTFHHKAR